MTLPAIGILYKNVLIYGKVKLYLNFMGIECKCWQIREIFMITLSEETIIPLLEVSMRCLF